MLFSEPDLDAHDLDVLREIEEFRASLRHFLATSRRWKGQIRRNLRARAMRGSNSIEGYDVSLDDAIGLLADDEVLDADAKTAMEVRGYRNAMTYILQLGQDEHFSLDESLIRSLHFMMLGHDLSKSPGSYRRSEIFVRDEDHGEIVYEGPDAADAIGLMAELVERIRTDLALADDPKMVFVRAAMAHLNFVMIHPFRDGNGRMARALQTLVLSQDKIVTPEFSSIEEWLGSNTTPYYDVLAATGAGRWSPQRSAHDWVRFNLTAHHMQAQTVRARVEESSSLGVILLDLMTQRGLPERLFDGLFDAASGLRVRRTVYEQDAGVEPATATRDLRAGVRSGLLVARGETRGRFYAASEELRRIYAEVRASRPKLIDPYVRVGDAARPRRRLSTTGR